MFLIKTLGKIKETNENDTLYKNTSEICFSQISRAQQTARKKQAKDLLAWPAVPCAANNIWKGTN